MIFIMKVIKNIEAVQEYVLNNTNIDVLGNFCSFPCSCKYINLHYKGNDNLRSSYINNLKYLYKVFNNKEVNIIPEAPDKEIMKKYGGFMTEY